MSWWQVYRGMLGGVRDVAVKVIPTSLPCQQRVAAQQLAIAQTCRDPSIVPFMGADVQEDRTILVMQQTMLGTLQDVLQSDTGRQLSWYNR